MYSECLVANSMSGEGSSERSLLLPRSAERASGERPQPLPGAGQQGRVVLGALLLQQYLPHPAMSTGTALLQQGS